MSLTMSFKEFTAMVILINGQKVTAQNKQIMRIALTGLNSLLLAFPKDCENYELLRETIMFKEKELNNVCKIVDERFTEARYDKL